MDNKLFYCPRQGVKIPVTLDLFKHGNGLWLALVNHEERIRIPLTADAATMAIELRRALQLIAEAVETKDHGHISRAGVIRAAESAETFTRPADPQWKFSQGEDIPDNIQPGNTAITVDDLRPGDSAYNWRLLVQRFPWMFAVDFEYKDAVKFAQEISRQPASQLDSDLEAVEPYLDQIIRPDGSINQSEAGRIIGVKNAGAGRERILRLVKALETKAA